MNDRRCRQGAIDGRNPTVLAELDASSAVIGDVQFLPGSALALTKVQAVRDLGAEIRRLRDAVEFRFNV